MPAVLPVEATDTNHRLHIRTWHAVHHRMQHPANRRAVYPSPEDFVMSYDIPLVYRSTCKCNKTGNETNPKIFHDIHCADRRQATDANGIAVHIGIHHGNTFVCVRLYTFPNARTVQMDKD